MHRPLAAALILGASTLSAAAETAIALAGDRTLLTIDTATGAVTASVDVQGADRLLGIDLRPGNGMLMGVTGEQKIVSIDPATGMATEVATMSTPLPLTDAPVIVDFNPAADRLRYMTGTTNHRVNPDTGEVTVDKPLAYEGAESAMSVGVVAAAYTNSYGKPEKTAMFDIDAMAGALVQQTTPNDGTLKTIGTLGLDGASVQGFDIATTADGTNTAWLVAGGMLYTVDLATGIASGAMAITGSDAVIRDITILPAM